MVVGAGVRADDVARGLLEHPDELAADDLALLLGVGDAGERVEEAVPGIDDDEVDAGGRDEVLLDLLRLARAQQPVVDEHARQLVTHGTLDQGRRHGRVDPTGETADDPLVADLVPDRGDELLDDVLGGPLPREAGAAEQEVLEHLLPERRVEHLGVPLDAVEPALVVLEAGHGGARRGRRDPHARRRLRHGVAVAHPHRLVVGLAVEQGRLGVEDARGGRTELGEPRPLHGASERLRHRLEAVAHAEDGDTGLEHGGVEARRPLLVDR
jgi:hypothetical protein